MPVTMETRSRLPVISFVDAAEFDAWLQAQPEGASGLWLKLVKKGIDLVSVSKSDAIDVALCHGWIDGKLESYDTAFWLVRFTPRSRLSKWSALNRRRAEVLIELGRMRPTGLAKVEAAKADGQWEKAYAPASLAKVPDDLHSALSANPEAAAFFAQLNGANRYAILYRIGAVKKAETRARKVAEFVAMLERGEKVHD